MKDIKNFLESKGAVIHDKHPEEDDEDEDTVTEDHNRQGMYPTLFKIIKSPQWNCHTSIPALSIHMHFSNVKIGHMFKFCWHPGSKGQKQVKNGQKKCNICLFQTDLGLRILDTERIWKFG